MKVKDLKTGMVVRLRNNKLFRVMLGTKHGDRLVSKNGNVELANTLLCNEGMAGYDDNLLRVNYVGDSEGIREIHKEFDIMQVWEPDHTQWGLTKFDFNHLDLIFKRE